MVPNETLMGTKPRGSWTFSKCYPFSNPIKSISIHSFINLHTNACGPSQWQGSWLMDLSFSLLCLYFSFITFFTMTLSLLYAVYYLSWFSVNIYLFISFFFLSFSITVQSPTTCCSPFFFLLYLCFLIKPS